jgi:hypothetical protein
MIEKLKIIEGVKNREPKASLFRKFGIPEVTTCSWMKENKLRSFVDSVEDDVTAWDENLHCVHSEVDECLYNGAYRCAVEECMHWVG